MLLYNTFLLTFILIVVVFSGNLLIGKAVDLIKGQIQLRKEILLKIKEEGLDVQESNESNISNENTPNFNRGVFEKRKTIDEEKYKRKVEIIEEINPNLFKQIAFLIVLLILFTLNINLMIAAYEEFHKSYQEILLYSTYAIVFVALIGILKKKLYLSIAILITLFFWNKAILLYASLNILRKILKK